MSNWFKSFINLIFPHCCIVCDQVLSQQEKYICVECLSHLPKTNFHLIKDNNAEKRFWGKFTFEKAFSYFYYTKESDFSRILYELKYKGNKEIGLIMGRYMSNEIISSGFFSDIDMIIPVPLHKKRYKKRGYNQSEWIAKGISEITGIPIRTDIILRNIANPTQTNKNIMERWENVEGVFTLNFPLAVENKHILLVDDVLTTGATITSCATILQRISNLRISIITLSIA